MKDRDAVASAEMQPEDFDAWLQHMGMSEAEAAKALGLPSALAVRRYREHGAPKVICLACAALAYGLPNWRAAAGIQVRG